MFQSDNELKALDEAHAPRLQYFQSVILGGFTKGVPSEVKLWDIKPMVPDGLEPAQREIKYHRNLGLLAEQLNANEEQVEATERAYSASAGLSLVHGGPKTGKTATALLQALLAVSMGHKVILCAPVDGNDDLESLFKKHWSKMPENVKPNVHISRNPASETYLTKFCELAAASNDPDCTMPTTLGHGVWKTLRENTRIFNTPEKQALYKDHQKYHTSLQHLVESQLLWDLMPTIRGDPYEDDYKRFLHLYNKVYFRVIAQADIIITSCHSAGVEELYSHFRPTVAIVDNCNLAAESEA